MFFQKRSCVVCGRAVDESAPHAQKYCTDPRCKWEHFGRLRKLAHDSHQALKRERENLNRRARDLRDSAAAAAGIPNPEDFTPVAIPVNMRRVRHLPQKRRRAFCDQLTHLIDQAAAEQCSPARLTDDAAMQKKCDAHMQTPELHLILANACAVCRGRCCTCGQDHAYLQLDTVVRYMHQHPDLQPNQVLDEYLSYLPKKTYEDSCVYHTEFGCAIPLSMRSESCHSFACEGLVELEEHVIDTKSTRFFLAAMEGNNILRSAFVECDQPG